jgi:hypothetical protein
MISQDRCIICNNMGPNVDVGVEIPIINLDNPHSNLPRTVCSRACFDFMLKFLGKKNYGH